MSREGRVGGWSWLGVAVALVVGLAGGVVLDRAQLSVGVPQGARDDFALMAEAWRTIERAYVAQAQVEPRQMAYSAINGIVATLGDQGHTRFLTPEMAARHANQIAGEFEGIGAYIESQQGQTVIVTPIDGSPTERAGLWAGNVIVAVEGEDVRQLTLGEVSTRVLGSAGTEVTEQKRQQRRPMEQGFPEYLQAVFETGDVRSGSPLPLGVHREGEGVNFALFSRHATGVRAEAVTYKEDWDFGPALG